MQNDPAWVFFSIESCIKSPEIHKKKEIKSYICTLKYLYPYMCNSNHEITPYTHRTHVLSAGKPFVEFTALLTKAWNQMLEHTTERNP